MKHFYLQEKDNVKVCKGDLCVEAKGELAEIIAISVAFAFICAGIAALVKS